MTFDAIHRCKPRSRIGQGLLQALTAAMLTLALSSVAGPALAVEAKDPWPELARDIFNGRELADGAGVIAIEMPYRAEDASIVPVTLHTTLQPGDTRAVKAVTLVIDENPAPVAATFQTGPGVTMISTRVRVDSYTNVHAVAELSDGQLYASTVFVKASGGCSAPMVKSMDEALATLGQMKFRILPATPEAPNEALLMIRHPNNSGLQMDQVTRLYTPARYIDKLAVYQGVDLVFSMAAGISISEDPNFRFTFKPNGAKEFRVEAEDTAGKTFSGAWPATRDGA